MELDHYIRTGKDFKTASEFFVTIWQNGGIQHAQ